MLPKLARFVDEMAESDEDREEGGEEMASQDAMDDESESQVYSEEEMQDSMNSSKREEGNISKHCEEDGRVLADSGAQLHSLHNSLYINGWLLQPGSHWCTCPYDCHFGAWNRVGNVRSPNHISITAIENDNRMRQVYQCAPALRR